MLGISPEIGLPEPNIKITIDKPIINNSAIPNISKRKIFQENFGYYCFS